VCSWPKVRPSGRLSKLGTPPPSAAVHRERKDKAAALLAESESRRLEALLTSEGVSLSVLTRRRSVAKPAC